MDNLHIDLLEFDRLLSIISEFSHSEASRTAVRRIHPLDTRQEIETRQGRIHEIMRISEQGRPLGLSHFEDVGGLIAKVRPEGSVLEPNELSAFIAILDILTEIADRIGAEDDLPYLTDLTTGLTGFPEILHALKRSLDSEGNILDTASPLLSELRDRLRRLEARIRKRLEEMVREEAVSVFLQDDFVTKRSGRWVIPVRMDSKGQVPGVVHDVSKSGETAFIEPLAIISLANELENAVAEEKAEEIRILKNLSSMLRGSADGLQDEYATLLRLDVLNSIAVFSISLKMEAPRINETGAISLRLARHPLLQLSLQKTEGVDVVPLDVSLGGDNTIMVITGSNAGGKTIAIKTIGLLLIMALSGMPVPADPSSSFPLVRSLLTDIGDEQSIENNLSTFSAHISNISQILKKAGPDSLVLVDELGTGTDPEEGAALACALLNVLKESGALVFATTHLADIKGFVHRTKGMLNASMEFDRNTLLPLYKLRTGEPGQSHALETAKRYGLPDSIIESARGMLGGIKVEFDNLIADLNEKRASYESGLEELGRQKKELQEKAGLLEKRILDAESRGKEILALSYRQASDIVSQTKKEMHLLLDELKKKEKAERKEVLRQLESRQKEVAIKLRSYDADHRPPPAIEDIREGDVVHIESLGYDATVAKILVPQKRLRLSAGGKEIEVPLADIGLRKGRKAEVRESRDQAGETDEAVSSRINLVGLRVDEALSRLEPFLNHASLAGLPEVTVIHGLGAGILSRAVREHLTGHPLVKQFRGGERSEGGNGVTIATMA